MEEKSFESCVTHLFELAFRKEIECSDENKIDLKQIRKEQEDYLNLLFKRVNQFTSWKTGVEFPSIKDISAYIEKLEDTHTNSITVLPFILSQLEHVLPQSLREKLQLESLPNMTVLKNKLEVYEQAIALYDTKHRHPPLLKKCKEYYEQQVKMIEAMGKNEQLISLLMDEYQRLHTSAIHTIYHCIREKNNSSPNPSFFQESKIRYSIFDEITWDSIEALMAIGEWPLETTLEALIPENRKEYLMNLLNQLELNRLLLYRIDELAGRNPWVDADLDSKAFILGFKKTNVLEKIKNKQDLLGKIEKLTFCESVMPQFFQVKETTKVYKTVYKEEVVHSSS